MNYWRKRNVCYWLLFFFIINTFFSNINSIITIAHHFYHHQSGHKIHDFFYYMMSGEHHEHNDEDKHNPISLPECNHTSFSDIAINIIDKSKLVVYHSHNFCLNKVILFYINSISSNFSESIWQPPRI